MRLPSLSTYMYHKTTYLPRYLSRQMGWKKGQNGQETLQWSKENMYVPTASLLVTSIFLDFPPEEVWQGFEKIQLLSFF